MAIPPALAGKDICGRAPTGSGKTLAFGIPLSQRVTRARPKRPRALVLTPTRELAAQIRGELKTLLTPQRRTVASFYGGVSFNPQLKTLNRGVDVAVACPGRLADLVRRRNLILDEVEIVVVDEADRMADMGFLPEVKRILDQVRPDRQTMLFSATLDGDVNVLIKRYQHDPVRCEIEAEKSEIDKTAHRFVRTKREDRVRMAADLVTTHGSTIVFCRTKHGTDRVARQLRNAGVSAVPIHGGRSQSQRDRALASFTRGEAQALVATDVAARGIHVDDVACIVHFDVAGDRKDYVHRSGRTGRAGAEGLVVSFVTDEEVAKARRLQKDLDITLDKASTLTVGGAGSSPSAKSSRRRQRNRNNARRHNGSQHRGHPGGAPKGERRRRSSAR